jgi:hypothetical protein
MKRIEDMLAGNPPAKARRKQKGSFGEQLCRFRVENGSARPLGVHSALGPLPLAAAPAAPDFVLPSVADARLPRDGTVGAPESHYGHVSVSLPRNGQRTITISAVSNQQPANPSYTMTARHPVVVPVVLLEENRSLREENRSLRSNMQLQREDTWRNQVHTPESLRSGTPRSIPRTRAEYDILLKSVGVANQLASQPVVSDVQRDDELQRSIESRRATFQQLKEKQRRILAGEDAGDETMQSHVAATDDEEMYQRSIEELCSVPPPLPALFAPRSTAPI